MFSRIAYATARYAGTPAAFLTAFAVVLLWGVMGPLFGFSEGWQLVINTGTTIITFLMIFLVQASQNRDGAAVQAKLDTLIAAIEPADNRLIGADKLTEREVEELRCG